MKLITLEQRSAAWHAWRNGEDIDGPRITASNIAVIAGLSPTIFMASTIRPACTRRSDICHLPNHYARN